MRWLLLLVCLTICAATATAQEQENKLVDRLLRPDMSLANAAQDKKFTGTGATSVEKKFVARDFNAGGERTAKNFFGPKNFATGNFQAEKFTRAERAAEARANAELAYAKVEHQTKQSALLRTSAAEGKAAKTNDYAESTRPFLGRGTRQEILSQQDQPLTIEQVRDLLNKGK